MPERIYLDPTELATGRTELDITPWVKVDGVDWGDGDVEAYRSTGEFGESVIDTRIPNRQVTIPLSLRAVGGTSFATIRSAIQAKAGIIQREGGWLKRVTSSGGTLYADVQLSGLKLSGGWLQATKDADVESVLSLEVSPDFYGNEIQLSDHTETSAAELVFTETSISGDYPARVRVVVDEDDADAQLGLMWGFRRRNYSSAATARLQYEAEALQPVDTAARAALTGASGGTVVTHGTLSADWTPVLSMNMAGTAYLTHVGTYRWWCRYRTTSGTAVQLRGVYDVGDLVNPEENPRWTHPAGTAGTAFYIADLGQMRLDQATVGTHRWAGIIQGKGAAGSENVSIDKVWFQPLDESAGILRAPANTDPGLATFSARDNFDTHVGGTLVGKTAPIGGVWTGGGDADDFTPSSPGVPVSPLVLRTNLTDTAPRVDWIPVAMTNIAVQAQVASTQIGRTGGTGSQDGPDMFGVAAVTDATNWFSVSIKGRNTERALEVSRTIGGSRVVVATYSLEGKVSASRYYTLRLVADTSGRWWAYWSPGSVSATDFPGIPSASSLILVLSGYDLNLASGGTLATRRPGLVDYVSATPASFTRQYENLLAWAPSIDAVINPSQSLELSATGIVREDVGGTAYGPVSWVDGDLPRLPPTVGGTTEVFVKGSRGDLQGLPDTGLDDISGRISYRPCWLHPQS